MLMQQFLDIEYNLIKQPIVNLAMEDSFDLHEDPYVITQSFFYV
jgi:hypothetical protein